MLHMERNSDLVKMVCYAPLLCNVHNPQWYANMIYFDQYRAYGTPNYYVHKLLMNHCGTQLLEISREGLNRRLKVEVPKEARSEKSNSPNDAAVTVEVEELYISAAFDEEDESIIAKIINISGEKAEAEIVFEGCGDLSGILYDMKGFDVTACNSLEEPEAVSPSERPLTVRDGVLEYIFEAYSVTIFRLKSQIQL